MMIRTALALALLAAVTTALPVPSVSCYPELKEKCEASKASPTKCAACVEEHGKAANCTATEEKEFCHRAPTPPGPSPIPPKCKEELEDLCEKVRTNRTLCLDCAEENRKILENRTCTSQDVEEFCGPRPGPGPTPGHGCRELLETDCGNDRHNKTLCRKCIEVHAESLKHADCTEAEEAGFCEGPPVPPAPTAECEKVMDELCQADRHNHTLCVHCLAKHANETRAAKCTYTEEEKFCTAAPKPTPNTCEPEMAELCGADKHNRTLCVKCLETNTAKLHEHGCTETQEHLFCEPTPPSNHACEKAFSKACGEERRNHTLCMRCADEHAATLRAAGCTSVEIAEECRAEPPHPPHPPAPGAECERVLREDCEADRHNVTKCEACAAAHGAAGHCTSEEEHAFCRPVPPPPHPEPGHACEKALYEECEADHHSATLCKACVVAHSTILDKANCTAAEKEAFCAAKPPPAPSHACEELLVTDCGADKHNRTKCKACIHALGNKTEAAHCTYKQLADFCEAPAPPTPEEGCKSTEYCCPDAKACLTPVAGKACDAAAPCEKGQVCCPLTKMCVVPSKPCRAPAVCGTKAFCCPDAKACLTPVAMATPTTTRFCDPADAAACAAGTVCCPLIKQCVHVGVKCVPAATSVPAFMQL